MAAATHRERVSDGIPGGDGRIGGVTWFCLWSLRGVCAWFCGRRKIAALSQLVRRRRVTRRTWGYLSTLPAGRAATGREEERGGEDSEDGRGVTSGISPGVAPSRRWFRDSGICLDGAIRPASRTGAATRPRRRRRSKARPPCLTAAGVPTAAPVLAGGPSRSP